MHFPKFVRPPFVQPISGCYQESVVQLKTQLSTWVIRKFNLSLISTYIIQIFDLDLMNLNIAVLGHVTSKMILSGCNTQHSAQLVNLLWAILAIVFQLCLSKFWTSSLCQWISEKSCGGVQTLKAEHIVTVFTPWAIRNIQFYLWLSTLRY